MSHGVHGVEGSSSASAVPARHSKSEHGSNDSKVPCYLMRPRENVRRFPSLALMNPIEDGERRTKTKEGRAWQTLSWGKHDSDWCESSCAALFACIFYNVVGISGKPRAANSCCCGCGCGSGWCTALDICDIRFAITASHIL